MRPEKYYQILSLYTPQIYINYIYPRDSNPSHPQVIFPTFRLNQPSSPAPSALIPTPSALYPLRLDSLLPLTFFLTTSIITTRTKGLYTNIGKQTALVKEKTHNNELKYIQKAKQQKDITTTTTIATETTMFVPFYNAQSLVQKKKRNDIPTHPHIHTRLYRQIKQRKHTPGKKQGRLGSESIFFSMTRVYTN